MKPLGGYKRDTMRAKSESITAFGMRQEAGTPKEMSRIYGIPLGTLANLRCQKRGSKFFRRGRSILYFFNDFEAWLKRDPVLTVDTYEAEDER
jgi:hypothetical protein